MRIGLDLQVLNDDHRTGIGNYAFNLVRELLNLESGHEFILFTPQGITSPNPSSRGGAGEVKVVTLPGKKIPFYDAHARFAKIIEKENLDVFHGVANTIPLGLKGWNGGKGSKAVITVHDLAIYKHPEWFPSGQWFSKNIVVPRSIQKADRIIVPSETTKQDLQELFQVGEDKIVVVPMGVEERFFRANANGEPHPNPLLGKEREAKKCILFVGTVEPRKNIQRLIEAYEGVPEDLKQGYELWIVGNNPLNPPYLKGEGIRVLDYVADEELPGLYQNASLFVYPSLYDGFGLPVLEALASGVPVVTSKDSPMAEAAGDTAILVDPYSVEEIREGIMKSIPARLASESVAGRRDDAYVSEKMGVKGGRGEMGARGVIRAREYSWERTARETMRVYESLK